MVYSEVILHLYADIRLRLVVTHNCQENTESEGTADIPLTSLQQQT